MYFFTFYLSIQEKSSKAFKTHKAAYTNLRSASFEFEKLEKEPFYFKHAFTEAMHFCLLISFKDPKFARTLTAHIIL